MSATIHSGTKENQVLINTNQLIVRLLLLQLLSLSPWLKLFGDLLCLVPLFTSNECINAFFEHVHFDEQFSCLNIHISHLVGEYMTVFISYSTHTWLYYCVCDASTFRHKTFPTHATFESRVICRLYISPSSVVWVIWPTYWSRSTIYCLFT